MISLFWLIITHLRSYRESYHYKFFRRIEMWVPSISTRFEFDWSTNKTEIYHQTKFTRNTDRQTNTNTHTH